MNNLNQAVSDRNLNGKQSSYFSSGIIKHYSIGRQGFIHGGCNDTCSYLEALQKRHAALKSIELVSITTLGSVKF